jgi:hypothetical protein
MSVKVAVADRAVFRARRHAMATQLRNDLLGECCVSNGVERIQSAVAHS